MFDEGTRAGETGTRSVMWITVAMMLVEIAAGWWFNSIALMVDGWHMSSHAVAIGLSAFAYAAARRHADDPRFAFDTWKIEVLGGFASAILLLGVAAMSLRPEPRHPRCHPHAGPGSRATRAAPRDRAHQRRDSPLRLNAF